MKKKELLYREDNFQKTMREYLSYLQGVRGYSSRTAESYSNDLFRYANYCDNHGIDPDTTAAYEVQKFIAELSAENLASTTVNRCLSSIRGFYRWMVRFERRADNPCSGLKNVKTPKKLPIVLWENEMTAFSQLPENTKILWPARDKALIMIMYSAGLRVSELAALAMRSVSSNLSEARVLGKGGRERYVFFSDEAREALVEYLYEREGCLRNAGVDGRQAALFISRKARNLSVPGARWIIYRYAQQSNLGKNIHPHALRHSFATHLVNSGCDVRIVQEMLGHASLSTTQRYTHTNIDKLKQVYAASHPHSKEKSGES
jgi:integrase/recombinase XerC